MIQLGAWTDDQWDTFTHKLFAFHPQGSNQILELQVELAIGWTAGGFGDQTGSLRPLYTL
jgi:hypothetical protein